MSGTAVKACPQVMRLLNSVVDVCLVYGIDETCTRELEVNEEEDIHACYESLLTRDIKLHFLQILAPGQVYPERSSSPPLPCATPTGEEGGVISHAKRFNVEELGLSWDTVETLHWFIFPEGLQLYAEDIEPSIVPMLLTNIDGARSYAVGVRFARPFFIQKPTNGRYYTLLPWKNSMIPPANSRLVFIPTCCVLVSQHPYFQFMKDALSGLHKLLSADDEDVDVDFWEVIKNYTERVFLVPTPPPGSLAVEFQLPAFASRLLIRPPRGDTDYLDIRLNYPFLCLPVECVLMVVAALLTEQRIIFLSSEYSMLTYCVQCFLVYISPFVWRHPCVPILPQQHLEYLEAPGTNIMGCHASVTSSPEFAEVEDAVIVVLDKGRVECRLSEPLPSLPHQAADTFKSRYEALSKRNFDLDHMSRLTHLSAEELERERAEFDHENDEALARMFLELMVNIYHNVTQQLIHSRMKYDETVRAMPTSEQEFYKFATCTDMFSSFYQSRRLYTQRDEFTLLAEKIKKMHRKASEDLETGAVVLPTGSLPAGKVGGAAPVPIPTASLPAGKMGGAVTASVMSSSLPRGNPPSPRSRQSLTAPPTYRKYSAPNLPSLPPGIPEDSLLSHSPTPSPSPLTTMSPALFSGSSLPPAELLRLELPPLNTKERINREAFVDEVVTSLTEMMQNKAVQAQCVYLRGFFRVCQKTFVAAFDDLYERLQRMEIQLVPETRLLQPIVAYLSEEELAELQGRCYSKLFAARKKGMCGPSGVKRQSSSYNLVNIEKKMPKKPLGLTEFMKIVNQNAIATDADSGNNLHHVLSHGRTNNHVDPKNFAQFYEAWKNVLQDNEAADLPGVELEKPQERVLAVADQIRSNFGIQCVLVLTTYRLLVVTSFKTHVMADLRKQLRFENCDHQLSILGSKTPCIRVERLGKESKSSEEKSTSKGFGTVRRQRRSATNDIYVAFQDASDREDWYRMIVEMQSGWVISKTKKDYGVMEAAECHVILHNALSLSGLLDKLNHSQRNKMSRKILSFSSKEVVEEVSKATVEALQYRINPCLHETERQTVESLLYIPPDPCDSHLGMLWIGLGNGRLRVYDMEARCFEADIKITERHGKSLRLSCLLLVGNHVWVGSSGRNIHILDAESVCHVSQISYLDDAPRDLALSQTEPRVVWSLLLNGILIAWDPETRGRVAKMQVPISDEHTWSTCTCFTICRERIWVGTNRGTICVMDSSDGRCVNEVFFPGGRKKQVEIKQLALSNEGEIWCSVYSIPRSEDSTLITVFDSVNMQKKFKYTDLDSRVSVILPVNNTMWCGTKSGKIYIFDATTYADGKGMPKILTAHDDFIRTMTMTDINLVVSGSGSNDGYAAVWKAVVVP